MSFTVKRGPYDPYERPEQPHHIHKNNGCNNHASADCTDDHWIGDRPEKDWPHHVEIDLSTGLVGYMRLTQEEVHDLELLWEYEADHNLTEKA